MPTEAGKLGAVGKAFDTSQASGFELILVRIMWLIWHVGGSLFCVSLLLGVYTRGP